MRRLLIASITALALALPLPAVAQDDAIAMVPVELPEFGIAAVAPDGWTAAGGGRYLRGTPPDDVAALAIQAGPFSTDQLWASLLPSLLLDAIPDATGELATDVATWSLHRIPVEFQGIELMVEVAVGEGEGESYLVLFQAAPDEFDALRDDVLVPAVEAFRPLADEPPAADLAAEEVRFPGGDEGVELAGTLTLPDGPGPHPAIVLMSGSGPQDRDSSFPGLTALKPFAEIATALTEAGLAVLRYDDRGVGASSGVHADAVLQDFAGDGAAAIDYLSGRADIDPDRIGILGHSEGGAYASILGATDPRVAFIVALAPPAIPGVELLVEQNEAVVRASGADDEDVASTRAFAETVMPLARDGDRDGVEAAVRAFFGAAWDRLSPAEQVSAGDRDAFVQAQVDAQLDVLLSDSYRALLAYDPAPDWARVTVPVLGIFGALDVQVPSGVNEPALIAALEDAGNGDVTTVVLADANHLFQSAETGALSEYSQLEPTLTPELLSTLVDWAAERALIGADG